MGKVKDAVKKHIKNGDVIACDVEADFTVVAGKGFLVGWESSWYLRIELTKKHLSFQVIFIGPFQVILSKLIYLCIMDIFWRVKHMLLQKNWLKTENAPWTKCT